MSLFDGIESATIGKGGFYFEAGRYIVDVVKVHAQQDRKGQSMFIIEAAIAWTDCPTRKVGQVPSNVIMQKWDTFLGNVKAFLGACNGADPNDDAALAQVFVDANGNDITKAMAEMAVGPDNPLAGTRLELNCNTVKTKSGGDFTVHKWKPYDEAAFAASIQNAI